MCRLIATPPGWIERDHEQLVGPCFVDDTQHVAFTEFTLCDPAAPLGWTSAIRLQERLNDILFVEAKPVVAQEDEFPSRIRRKTNGFCHRQSLTSAGLFGQARMDRERRERLNQCGVRSGECRV